LIEVDALEAVPAVIEQVEAAARSSGSTFALLVALALRGWARARCGELAAAEADVAAALQLAEEADLLMGVTTALFFLIDVLLERDSLPRFAELAEATELSPDFMRTASGANLVEARGCLRVLRRDRERGIEDLRAAGRVFSALRFGPAHSSWRSALALALPRTDRARAHELAGEELELAETCGLPRPIGIALRTLGVLEDGAAGIDLLTRSVSALESSPARLEHARSVVELGARLRRANRRAEARAPLTSGFVSSSSPRPGPRTPKSHTSCSSASRRLRPTSPARTESSGWPARALVGAWPACFRALAASSSHPPPGNQRTIKEFGFGLGFAVFLDALVVRCVLLSGCSARSASVSSR
jgi:hypothetical protein